MITMTAAVAAVAAIAAIAVTGTIAGAVPNARAGGDAESARF